MRVGTSGGFGGSNCGGSMAIGLAGSGESGVPGGSHMGWFKRVSWLVGSSGLNEVGWLAESGQV
jgi:hypothetical protein